AYNRMRANEVSQLPVIDGTRVVGVLDEEDILAAAYADTDVFGHAVAKHMTDSLDVIDIRSDTAQLMALFAANKVAIVMDGAQFVGMITRVDLINHLRQSVS
ncbi:MAG: CBS domain-containing protein, partial [Pseudomonadota bacterium]|nr:CBS domain-containing protein [Pseudomonadota bacterium]